MAAESASSPASSVSASQRSRIVYDKDLIKVMTMFESFTGASLKDCFNSGSSIYFVVSPEDMGKSIGRNGANIKRIEEAMKKNVRVLEFSPDLATFIKNLIYPITARQIKVEDGTVTITGEDSRSKGLLIGRNSSNLNSYKQIIRRYFEIRDLRVV